MKWALDEHVCPATVSQPDPVVREGAVLYAGPVFRAVDPQAVGNRPVYGSDRQVLTRQTVERDPCPGKSMDQRLAVRVDVIVEVPLLHIQAVRHGYGGDALVPGERVTTDFGSSTVDQLDENQDFGVYHRDSGRARGRCIRIPARGLDLQEAQQN